MQNKVFEHADLAGISLKNRIIRSATHEGMADEKGLPTESLKKTYIRLAKGGAGAIITGYAGIRQDGKSPLHRMLMVADDSCIAAYRELVDEIHALEVPIILQIAHCGRQTSMKATGLQPIAPSSIRDKFYSEDKPRALTENEISDLIEDFARAALRAKQAGFDGVELHAAHGYLLSQFLSPYMNRRTDRWGGTTENRFRIIGEIYEKAREKVGDYPIFMKLNAHDGRKSGMRVEEAVQIARLMEQSGCNGIEVSCGVAEDGLYMSRGEHTPIDAVFAYSAKFKHLPGFIKSLLRPLADYISPPVKPLRLYNLVAASIIKQNVTIPIILVGGITRLDEITEVIGTGSADFVSMSRPFIIEADIVNKFQEGKQTASKCITCNYCMIAAEERPLQCYYGKIKL